MFEGLKARMERFFADATPPADRRAQAGALRSAIIEARVAVVAMRDALRRASVSSRSSAARPRTRSGAASWPGDIGDLETVAVAEKYAVRHRERLAVVERRIAVQREELMLAEREMAEMTEALRGAPGRCRGRQRTRCLA